MPPLERLARSIDLHSTSFGGGDFHAAPSGQTCPWFPPFVPGSLPRRPTGLSVSDASTQPVKKQAAGRGRATPAGGVTRAPRTRPPPPLGPPPRPPRPPPLPAGH